MRAGVPVRPACAPAGGTGCLAAQLDVDLGTARQLGAGLGALLLDLGGLGLLALDLAELAVGLREVFLAAFSFLPLSLGTVQAAMAGAAV
jgi:hypothetical protein